MSNWNKINAGRVREGMYASSNEDGFNGAFGFIINGLKVRVIASDGAPGMDRKRWQHVSVSIHGSSLTPSWPVMCQVKELFWEPEDWVVQFHPAKSENISNHPGCLHMWKPLDQALPLPPSIAVGKKEWGEIKALP